MRSSGLSRFFVRRWFLIVLAAVLLVGISFSAPLEPLARAGVVRQSIVATVMFLMALPLQATAFWTALRKPLAPLLASVINYGLLPLAAWGIVASLIVGFGYDRGMGYGILIAATAPCTLASASVWTRRAGGNDAAAIIVTILTNSLCFLITPAWLSVMLGEMPDFEPLAMVAKLGLLVVLPMTAAQLLRLIGSVGSWSTKHKTPLSVLAQCGILFMVLLGAIRTGRRFAEAGQPTLWIELAGMLLIVLGLHLGMLVVGLKLSRWLGLSPPDAIAVGFAGSQKTLMVGLEVSVQLGITILPMVAYHVGQLLTDTIVADRLRAQQDRKQPPPE